MESELKLRNVHNFKYHPPLTQQRIDQHQRVREVTLHCANKLVDLCPASRELSLALVAMEEAMMWANAAIARNDKEED